MSIDQINYFSIVKELQNNNCILVAVSKTKPVEDIKALYDLGHRDFGENYVQELTEKYPQLPDTIRWHFIGHLQTNKVKYIAPFVHLVQSVDSEKLLKEINKQAQKNNRVIDVLLQAHIAEEETKFGLDEPELDELLGTSILQLSNIRIKGLMGMASFTDNREQVRKEFQELKWLFDKYHKVQGLHGEWQILSMGMSSDFEMAVESGSNMVRIGSMLFGSRD